MCAATRSREGSTGCCGHGTECTWTHASCNTRVFLHSPISFHSLSLSHARFSSPSVYPATLLPSQSALFYFFFFFSFFLFALLRAPPPFPNPLRHPPTVLHRALVLSLFDTRVSRLSVTLTREREKDSRRRHERSAVHGKVRALAYLRRSSRYNRLVKKTNTVRDLSPISIHLFMHDSTMLRLTCSRILVSNYHCIFKKDN